MPLTPTREVVDAARGRLGAAVAFNVIGLEHVEAVVRAAEQEGRGVLLQVSANAVAFRGAIGPLAAACRAAACAARVPVGLHLDHACSIELCAEAVDAGFSSVMLDLGGRGDADGVAATAEAAAWAHQRGLWFEGELGAIGGKPGDRDAWLTDVAQARSFVTATHVDALAVSVGNRHKMTTAEASLDLERIVELRDATGVPLVLHGSSGVPDAELGRAVRAGITKVNVGTRLSVAYREGAAAAREQSDSDPRPELASARDAMVRAATGVLRATDAGR